MKFSGMMQYYPRRNWLNFGIKMAATLKMAAIFYVNFVLFFKVVRFRWSFFLNRLIWRVDCKYDLSFDLWPHGDLEMTLKRSNFKVVRFGRSFFLFRTIWRVDYKCHLIFYLWPHGDLEMTFKRSNFKVVRFGQSFF